MANLFREARYASRVLIKNPSFALISVLTLALAIGANTAIFSIVNGILLKPLPYADADRLVVLWQANQRVRTNPVSYPNFQDWRNQSQSFEYISGHTGRWGGPDTVIGGIEPLRAYTVGVLRDFFAVFKVMPVLGRTFSSDESNYGTVPVAVVSFRFWKTNLNADTNLANHKLTIGGRQFEVIGVMPATFNFPQDTDVWL